MSTTVKQETETWTTHCMHCGKPLDVAIVRNGAGVRVPDEAVRMALLVLASCAGRDHEHGR